MLNVIRKREVQIVLFAILAAIAWPQIRKLFNEENSTVSLSKTDEKGIKLLTATELSLFNGKNENVGLYLSILGSIYDVKKGFKHYGPDGSYHFFVGRDASKSFVTGEFGREDADLDNVLQLTPKEVHSIIDWKSFYDKEYVFVGKLIGRFYDNEGKETHYLKNVFKQQEIAMEEKKQDEKLKELFPPCNVEWKVDTGTRVWCTDRSGGLKRDWIGYPRKFYEPGAKDFRCACIHSDNLLSGNLKEFDNCASNSLECFYSID